MSDIFNSIIKETKVINVIIPNVFRPSFILSRSDFSTLNQNINSNITFENIVFTLDSDTNTITQNVNSNIIVNVPVFTLDSDTNTITQSIDSNITFENIVFTLDSDTNTITQSINSNITFENIVFNITSDINNVSQNVNSNGIFENIVFTLDSSINNVNQNVDSNIGFSETALINFTVNGNVPDLLADFTGENYFKADKVETTFDDMFNFNRASTATYIDSNGILQTVAAGVPRRGHHIWNGTEWVNKGVLIESEARTNLLLNSDTFTTQNVTVTNEPHTIHFTGTGTITLSGASAEGPITGTGTGENNRVNMTFTPTAGTLTLTVSGSVTNAQLEVGSTPSSYIPTAGATVTRAAETIPIPAVNLPYDATAMSIAMKGTMTYADNDTTQEDILVAWGSGNDFIQWWLRTSLGEGRIQFVHEINNVRLNYIPPGGALQPGLNVPVSVAGRFTNSDVQQALNGISYQVASVSGTPNLSTSDLGLARNFIGTIESFVMWGNGVGLTDAELEEATL